MVLLKEEGSMPGWAEEEVQEVFARLMFDLRTYFENTASDLNGILLMTSDSMTVIIQYDTCSSPVR